MSLDELLRASDYVVVSCALTDATRGLLSREKLGLMRQSACIINVSRGAVIDETALVDVLRAERIAGAALDVFQDQPLPAAPFTVRAGQCGV